MLTQYDSNARLRRLTSQVVPTTGMSSEHAAVAVIDAMGNLWEVAPPAAGAPPALLVTPNASGLSTTSQPTTTVSLPAGFGPPTALAVDVAGFVWTTDGAALCRADPRDEGAMQTVTSGLPAGPLEGLRRHPSGYAAVTVGEAEFTVSSDTATPAPTTPPSASGWKETARLPCGNHDIAAAVLGDTLYISGGLAPGGFPNQYRVFDEVWAFDGEAWKEASRMPGRRTFSGIAAAGDELWICGGADGMEGDAGAPADRVPRAECFILNPATGVWREGPPMATARIECWSCSVNERVYTFGGASLSAGGESFTSVESIAPGDSEWRAEPAMPLEYGLRQYGGCVLDGKVYLVGGCDEHGDAPSNRAFLCFDPTTGSWCGTRPV